jgi:maltooligosyltrehalose trehalohydrolase
MIASTPAQLADAPLGATRLRSGEWQFVLWAPNARHVSVHVLGTKERLVDMISGERGYHVAVIEPVEPGTRYLYRLDDSRELPDPASRFQPGGVHGPSQLVDTRGFVWGDKHWIGVPLERSVFYEIHTGTYTEERSFEGLIRHLDGLAQLGVTTIELMPVGQFSGSRNWGYDGVYPFAPQASYGGPTGLQRLVNAVHAHGLAVALDVVYNHLGPEGNYLPAYGQYFTDRYRTPWGEAINYDGAHSDEVRRFFIENALYWLEEYHFDVLRLDAIHSIFDFSASPFLAELKSAVADLSRRLGRQIHLIAESDLNDSHVILPREKGGYGLDGQWSDDFHHALQTLLTKEKTGYYQDFGDTSQLATILREGWYFRGQYSRFRERKHGNSTRGLSPAHFVVCNQNHDQVGNRAAGERLSVLVDFESQKLAAGATLLSPFVPLLFMGEEYGETASFQYFTSHLDAGLVEAVRRGRREEFSAFGWEGTVPDPQDESTFRRSQLQHFLKEREPHATLLRFYKELIRLRRELDLGSDGDRHVWEQADSMVFVAREDSTPKLLIIFNFADLIASPDLPQWEGLWRTRMFSADGVWRGPAESLPLQVSLSKPFALRLHPHSFVVFERLASNTERR